MPAHGNAVKLFWQLLVFIIVCVFFLAALRANADLAAGRHVLFMDERITFDGVRQILHAQDLGSLLQALGDGGDHRYGRSLWNSMALAALAPERIWGETGQIIAGRLLQGVLLASAFLVFAFGLLRAWPLRALLVAALAALPHAHYYATMPKPEPLQLLFMALFCVFFLRANFSFGIYWIFLGLAFGTKISALPAVAVFAAASLLAARSDKADETVERAAIAGVAFFAGFAIAVPLFLAALLVVLGGFAALAFLRRRFRTHLLILAALAALCLHFAYVEGRLAISTWLGHILENTTHGDDRSGIGPGSWLSYFFGDWLVAPAGVGAAVVAVAALLGASSMPALRGPDGTRTFLGLVLLSAGTAWNVAMFVAAHRLWGFYLYPGTALAIVGLLVLADVAPASRLHRLAGRATAIALVGITCFYWAPRTLANLDALAGRTDSDEYRRQRDAYAIVTAFLAQRAAAQPRRLLVAFDPLLFPPQSNDRYRIEEFYNRYTNWHALPDVIVFSARHTPAGPAVPADSPQYPAYLAERDGYARYVAGKDGRCSEQRCFRRQLALPDGGEILVLEK
jgi:hypothetical protein